MNTYLSAALCAVTLFAALPASAEQVDVSSITCEMAAELDDETLTMLFFFIDGYTGGEAGDPVFDSERLSGDIDKVSITCAADGSKTLMDAMKEALPG
jgi:hypothetical protein